LLNQPIFKAEIRRITVQSQPRQIAHETLSQKNPITKNWAGGEALGEDSEFKFQFLKKPITFDFWLYLLQLPPDGTSHTSPL
jgi:hypothetical protein